MTNVEIVSELQKGRVIESIIKKYSICAYEEADDLRDLVQDLYLYLLEYDNKRLDDIYRAGEINYFICGMIRRQVYSDKSQYYKNYKKFRELTEWRKKKQ